MILDPHEQAVFSFLAEPDHAPRAGGGAVEAGGRRPPRSARSDRGASSLRPVHVTLRWHDRVLAAPCLTGSAALAAAVRAAAAASAHRPDFHLFHATGRVDGVYLLAQAETREALAAGVRAFAAAATRRVNRALRSLGPVLAEGHSVQELPAAAEFSHALRLLLGGGDEPQLRRSRRR